MLKFIKQALFTVFYLSFLGLFACSTTGSDPAEAYKGESGTQIYQEGVNALRDKSYGDSIKHFEALDAQYPFSEENAKAQLYIIYAYYMTSEYLTTEMAADRFIHAHPANPHVDYAYFLRGLANYNQNIGVFERMFTVDLATRDLSQVKKSFNDFSELVTRFPHSVYAPAALQYMTYLRNLLANHQLEVAQYYFGREAYVASVNRASIVVEHFQGSPAVPQALVLMAKSYHALNQKTLENQVITLLRENFPNSEYLSEALSDEAKPALVRQAPTQHVSTDANLSLNAVVPETKVTQVAAGENETLSQPIGNGTRGNNKPVTLTQMFNATDENGFFTLHKKPQPVSVAPPGLQASNLPSSKAANVVAPKTDSGVTQDAASNADTSTVSVSNDLASNEPTVIPPSVDSFFPNHANGSR